MSRPKEKDCRVIIRHGDHSVRAARFGRSPLIHLWVHHDNYRGVGIVLRTEQADELIEALADMLDEIEDENWPPRDD